MSTNSLGEGKVSDAYKKFGTIEGVFTPTILTIIGVILYLRLGWVVGNTGLLGALLIIGIAHVASITTGLAMSSMTTNVKIKDGGFYSILSLSLGLEVGGAIGVSLYLSQALSAALYIVGFTEAWLSVFPSHPMRLVSCVLLLILLILSFISTRIALRFQYIIMGVIALSLLSFVLGKTGAETHLVLWNKSSGVSFWEVFAVFFPAVTGISAGVALSGELKKPRKNIPLGLMSAILAGLFIYVGVAFYLSINATTDELMSNTLIMKTIAKWGIFIVAGVMGATVSSALGSILGAPRILYALAKDRIIIFSKIFSKRSKNGEPRYALVLTTIIIFISIMIGDLNTIAPLLTMFFLITYGMINVAVFIEQSIGITSFRPTFKIPIIVPLIGSLWCFIIMFIINFIFASIALVLVIAFYIIQVKRGMHAPWGDVRGAMFHAIAEWALKTSARLPQTAKNWKPNIVVPIEDPEKWRYIIEFIKDIAYPKGTLRLFSIVITEDDIPTKINKFTNFLFRKNKSENYPELSKERKIREKKLNELSQPIEKQGIFTTTMTIEANELLNGLNSIIQVMKGMFFPPNIMFLTMSRDRSKDTNLEKLISISVKEKLGVLILGLFPKVGFGMKKEINFWIRDKSPHQHLATLTAIELEKEWDVIRLIRVTDSEDKVVKERKDLERIVEEGRMPMNCELKVYVGNFIKILENSPKADLHIFGVSGELDVEKMHQIVDKTQSSCLFAMDSGRENALY